VIAAAVEACLFKGAEIHRGSGRSSVENRQKNFEKLARDLKLDIVVLIEVAGLAEAQAIARSLGWQRYFGVVSNFSIASTDAYQGLEVAVIRQIEIEGAVEFDASPEARGGFHEAFNEQGLLPGRVAQEQLSSVVSTRSGRMTVARCASI
jgi:hypothetical protein